MTGTPDPLLLKGTATSPAGSPGEQGRLAPEGPPGGETVLGRTLRALLTQSPRLLPGHLAGGETVPGQPLLRALLTQSPRLLLGHLAGGETVLGQTLPALLTQSPRLLPAHLMGRETVPGATPPPGTSDSEPPAPPGIPSGQPIWVICVWSLGLSEPMWQSHLNYV